MISNLSVCAEMLSLEMIREESNIKRITCTKGSCVLGVRPFIDLVFWSSPRARSLIAFNPYRHSGREVLLYPFQR